jgi:DNA-binding response OmpR family regulator
MKKTILILDDDDATRDVFAKELQEMGYDTFAFERKSDGFHCAMTNQPDLIISDIKSPEMGGFGFLKLIRANKSTEHIPVIIISGHADESRDEAMRLGANAVFAKPFDFDEVEKKIRELIGEE